MTELLRFRLARLATPIGEMLVVTDQRGTLRALDWDDHADRLGRLLDRAYGPGAVRTEAWSGADQTSLRLEAYFAGNVAAIDAIRTEAPGTIFQREVWAALREIPAGTTWSYRELAAHIGRPAAVRAVGMANGSNPIGLVAPCHRVIGADGSLTGYGGGLERKRWLLQHEAACTGRATPPTGG